MTLPFVSVIIPCYNAKQYIGETLESVCRQSWPNLEIIVVNDGSNDNSAGEIARFPRSRVTVIDTHNRGAAAARNLGYSLTTGDYIQFLDADDLLSEWKIEAQVKDLELNHDCVSSCLWSRFYKSPKEAIFNQKELYQQLPPLDWLELSRRDGMGMMFPAMWLVPREVARRAGPWREELSLGDDTEYFTRVLLASCSVRCCADAYCYYRSGIHGSLSRLRTLSAWRSQYTVIQLCEKYVLEREDSERMRRAFAIAWQKFAFSCHPYDSSLANSALIRSSNLYRVQSRPDGGPVFQTMAALLGWRMARRLQVISGRY